MLDFLLTLEEFKNAVLAPEGLMGKENHTDKDHRTAEPAQSPNTEEQET